MHRTVLPRNSEGAGNAGRWPHPQALCAEKIEMHTSMVRQGRNRTALPAQWLYGLLRDLPGVSGFLVPVVRRSLRFGRKAEIASRRTWHQRRGDRTTRL